MIQYTNFVNTPSEEFVIESNTYTYHHSNVYDASIEYTDYYDESSNQNKIAYDVQWNSSSNVNYNRFVPTDKFNNGLIAGATNDPDR